MEKTSTKYNFTMATVAFFFWGGWSYYINTSDQKSGLISGVTQGIISFLMTLIMVYLVTLIFNRLHNRMLKLFVPALSISLSMTVILTSIHYAVQTPHIMMTIAPSISMAFIFCIITALKLER